jgi:hypothetical protein
VMPTHANRGGALAEPRTGDCVMAESNFKDLETRGFLVVPSFLSADEVAQCVADFENRPTGEGGYRHSSASPEVNAWLQARVNAMLQDVIERTNVHADLQWGAVYFATGRGIDFPWHQDHLAYFCFQNYYDYLNFYIPIVKPRREKSNLSIVPFDVLKREEPGLHDAVVGGGASRFMRLGRRTVVFLDDRGTFRVAGDMERLAHTPHLSAGDLLLLRGDVIHRTQDRETERVSLSFRASSSKAVVKRARLADGGLYKARMMAKNASVSERMFSAFDAARKNEMEAHELLGLMQSVAAGEPKRGRGFARYLWEQKRRAGVLGRFVPRMIATELVGHVASAYDRYSRR